MNNSLFNCIQPFGFCRLEIHVHNFSHRKRRHKKEEEKEKQNDVLRYSSDEGAKSRHTHTHISCDCDALRTQFAFFNLLNAIEMEGKLLPSDFESIHTDTSLCFTFNCTQIARNGDTISHFAWLHCLCIAHSIGPNTSSCSLFFICWNWCSAPLRCSLPSFASHERSNSEQNVWSEMTCAINCNYFRFAIATGWHTAANRRSGQWPTHWCDTCWSPEESNRLMNRELVSAIQNPQKCGHGPDRGAKRFGKIL